MNELSPEMIQFVSALPPAAVALALVLVVVTGVLLAYAVLVMLGLLFRVAESPDGPTLAEQAEPLLRARRGLGRYDARFDRLIDGTQLGLSGETAAGLILFVGGLAAAAVGILTFDPLPALIVGLTAGLLLYFVFVLLQNRRKRLVQEQLPDGCFQLSRSLRSGLNLQAALRETARYVPYPLGGLLSRLGVALSLGESTRAAVRRVADDVELTEFDLFTEVLATNAESGGNMPTLLDRLAASIRDRNQYRGYFRSVTALSRITAGFLSLAGPLAVVLYLTFQPALFEQFIHTSAGWSIITAAAILEVVGLIWLFFLLRRRDEY